MHTHIQLHYIFYEEIHKHTYTHTHIYIYLYTHAHTQLTLEQGQFKLCKSTCKWIVSIQNIVLHDLCLVEFPDAKWQIQRADYGIDYC